MRMLPCLLLLVPFAVVAADDPKPKPNPKPGYETKAVHDPDGIGKFYLGREIAHVMGWQGAGWLERPEREKEEDPATLLKTLDIQPGQTVADVGAGSGYHVFRMVPLVGDKGKVIAVDIQPQMLKLVRDRATKEKIDTIETVESTETDPKLKADSVDLILLVDVYHEFSHPYEMTETMVAALKPGGRIAFVEFRLEDPKVPIKLVHKMSERQVLKEMAEFPAMEHTRTHAGLPWQHIVVFTKKKK